jgi:hypothetical protein
MILGSSRHAAVAATALVIGLGFSAASLAHDGNRDGRQINLTPEDATTKTIFDKSVIRGEIRKDADGNMVIYPGKNGTLEAIGDPSSDDQLLFDYTGDIYSVKTDEDTGELIKMREKIGNIEGTAAFPVNFAFISAGFKGIMDLLEAGYTLQDAMNAVHITQLPPVLDWTCNHCKMVIGDSTYVNIVDALDPINGNPEMIAKYDGMIMGGAAGALDSMRLDARAFVGLTPTAMNPITKEMSIRMAGCSAIVGVSGTNAGMLGTLCLNSTATFNVSGTSTTTPINNGSSITGSGTSNCVTVLHFPTM